MLLYSTGKDASKEKWDGAMTRFTDVVELFGADDARPLDAFTDDLRALVARAEHVYADMPQHHQHRHRHHLRVSGTRLLLKYLSRGQHCHDDDAAAAETQSYLDVIAASRSKHRSLAPLVGALRSVKSASEVEVMKASAEISARAHAKVSVWVAVGEDFC
jgi:intermediate cleaving peptidase 55